MSYPKFRSKYGKNSKNSAGSDSQFQENLKKFKEQGADAFSNQKTKLRRNKKKNE